MNADGQTLLISIRERIYRWLQEAPAGANREPGAEFRASGLSELRELCLAAAESFGAVGSLPPSPRTVRGRVGKFLIGIIRRLLFWYTPQITAFNAVMARIAALQLDAIQGLCDRLENEARLQDDEARGRELEGQARDARLKSELAGLRNEIVQRSMAAQQELERPDGELKRALRRVDLELASYKEALNEVRSSYAGLQSEILALRQHAEDSLAGHLRSDGHARILEFERALARLSTEQTLQSQRISILLLEARRNPEQQLAIPAEKLGQELDHRQDTVLAALEDVSRGSRDAIKNHLRIYLPSLKAAGAGSPDRPVLDVGCGRGELLELLAEEGLAASGVDANRAMVFQCRERRLKATECDAVRYLRQLPDGSLGAVTAIHILEHLPVAAVLEVFGEAVRVLKPGGLAIFETPNPANLLVGSYGFYTDPTHRKPLPSPMLAFLAEASGLCEIEVLPLNPAEEATRIRDDGSEVVRWLNERFYGPQDYAVVGRRP